MGVVVGYVVWEHFKVKSMSEMLSWFVEKESQFKLHFTNVFNIIPMQLPPAFSENL